MAMAKQKSVNVPQDKLALYEKLLQTIPAIERKGDKVPYTSLNGNMFSYLNNEGAMALRLDEESREAFLTKYNAGLMKAYGIVQKEYVEVPESLLKKTSDMKPWLAKSYAYVKSLKAKPTKRG
jgi:hypothetical protein